MSQIRWDTLYIQLDIPFKKRSSQRSTHRVAPALHEAFKAGFNSNLYQKQKINETEIRKEHNMRQKLLIF